MLRNFIESHFGLVLILSCVAGLIVPGLPLLPNEAAIVTLAALTFISCYRLRDGGLNALRWPDIGKFFLLRYMILPALMYVTALGILPGYATGIFLIALLPAAVSSPAFAHIFGGAVPPAFAVVALSHLAAPLLIPLQFALIGDAAVSPAPGDMFVTLLWALVAPMIAYALVRRHKKSAAYFYAQGKFLSILLIAFIIALVVANQRAVILDDPAGLIGPLVVAISCFFIFILSGWFIATGRHERERITYTICSGFNNAALGVSLALVHFPPPVILFVAASEIAWALLPFMVRGWLEITKSRSREVEK